MNGVAYQIAGVMPESFDLTTDSEELWTPIAFTPAQRAMHDEHYLAVYGRLKPGVDASADAGEARRGGRRACVTIFRKTTRPSASARCRSSSSSSATSGSGC